MLVNARCLHCGEEFALARLLDDWTCRCPGCGEPLADTGADRASILRNAAAIDRLHGELLQTLRRLADLPGRLQVQPSPLLAAVAFDGNWEQRLRTNEHITQGEIHELQAAVRALATADRPPTCPRGGTQDEVALARGMRELANRLRHVADMLEHSPAASHDGAAAQHAAASVDRAAADLAAGFGDETDITSALDQARNAVAGQTRAPRRAETHLTVLARLAHPGPNRLDGEE